MNANELMIGDWVTCPEPFRVTGIYDDEPREVYDEDGLPCELAYVSPIPITPEILEANGWKKDPCYETPFAEFMDIIGYDWRANDHDYPLQLYQFLDCKKWKVFGGAIISYVHELQHALRLCGLGELADNFKVK